MSAEIAQQKSDETADGDRWVVVDLRALLRTNLGLELRRADLAKVPVEVISTMLGTGADPIRPLLLETDAVPAPRLFSPEHR